MNKADRQLLPVLDPERMLFDYRGKQTFTTGEMPTLSGALGILMQYPRTTLHRFRHCVQGAQEGNGRPQYCCSEINVEDVDSVIQNSVAK